MPVDRSRRISVASRTASCVATAAALLLGVHASAQEPSDVARDTLFLTWQEDPTTTMTIQWLEHAPVLPMVGEGQVAPLLFDVPRLEGVTIDGDAGDWGDRGFHVAYLDSLENQRRPLSNFDGNFRLGWDDQGLLLFVTVRDDAGLEIEGAGKQDITAADSVEIFVGQGVGQKERYQVMVAPGVDGKNAEPRVRISDSRKDKSVPPTPESARRKIDGGYTLELRLPWTHLNIAPQVGAGLSFQLYINDKDGDERTSRLVWFPVNNAWENPSAAYPLRLAEKPTAPVRLHARTVTDAGGRTLAISALASQAGRAVEMNVGDIKVASGKLREVDGHAVATLELPAAPQGKRWGLLQVTLDGEPAGVVEVPVGESLLMPEPGVVSFGRADGEMKKQAKAITKGFTTSTYAVQRVHLTGLRPGTLYRFQVRGDDRSFTFLTAPRKLDKPLVFAEGGDVGTGETVPPLHRLAASWDPLFGFVGGDLAYCNGVNHQAWLNYLNEWSTHMVTAEGRMIPMIVGIGNHEVRGGSNAPRENGPFFFALFDGLFKTRSYATLDFGNYLSLVILDTAHNAPIEGEQTAWLDKALASRLGGDKPVPHVFPMYHVPAYPSVRGAEGGTSEAVRTHWVPLFQKHSIRTVFEHHDHSYKRTHRLIDGQPTDSDKGVLYLGDGAWGRTPRVVDPTRPYLAETQSKLHVIRVTLDGKKQSYLMVDSEGQVIDQYPVVAGASAAGAARHDGHDHHAGGDSHDHSH